jgi:methylthioribose-1-phosphate isomerase
MRTIEWVQENDQVRLIDQRRLPRSLEYLTIENAVQMAAAIRDMAIRGAPALGVAGAFGMALEAVRFESLPSKDLHDKLRSTAAELIEARPTAVNLGRGVNQILKLVNDPSIPENNLVPRIKAIALDLAEQDVKTNLLLAEHGASLIDDGDTIIHHCNTGSLAVVDSGTALGAIRYAHEQGKKVHLLVDETRPRLQGSRLTAWECEQYGIPYEIITDNMAGYFLRSGKVQKVYFGADRVAANGDVVNKVGTYMLSLAAHANQIPVICVFPLSTLDLSIPNGDLIPIEERDPQEVLKIRIDGEPVAPANARALNPAFDITPHELISALVTEAGVVRPPFDINLARYSYNQGLER